MSGQAEESADGARSVGSSSDVATPTTSELEAASDVGSRESSFMRAVAAESTPASRRAEPERIGQKIGRYTIRERLGAGGMGVVYRADDEQLARPVALKVLRQRAELGAEHLRRFVREARAASAVRHPNVASVYEVGEHGDDAFIAMELLPGASLRARIRQGPVEIAEAVRIVREVAKALGAAHAAGVVHRDLKPDNVILEPDGRIKVLDFGLARWTPPSSSDDPVSESLTEEGMILGTPGYMSPEQVSGRKVDARSDYFSLGVLLFELLTGQRPFRGATKMDVLVSTSRDPAPSVAERRKGVSKHLQVLVASLLEKQPENRPATAEAIVHELDRSGSAGDRPTWQLAAVGVVAIAAIAGGLALMSGGEPRPLADTASPAAQAPATGVVPPAAATPPTEAERDPTPAAPGSAPRASASVASPEASASGATPARPPAKGVGASGVGASPAAPSPGKPPPKKPPPPSSSARTDEVWNER